MLGPAGPFWDQLLMGTRNLLVVLAVFHKCSVVVVAPLCEVIKDSALDALNGCDLWSQSGFELVPSSVEKWSLKHCTAREAPALKTFDSNCLPVSTLSWRGSS